MQAKVEEYNIARFAVERDQAGGRLVVHSGSRHSRDVLTSAGAVEVTTPRVKAAGRNRRSAVKGSQVRILSPRPEGR